MLKLRLLLLLAACLVSSVAWAGSYLDRAALLVSESRQAGAFLRERPHDRELAKMVHALAEARLAAAKEMIVPKEVVLAHPHLLLVLEHQERAARAASQAELSKVLALTLKAEEEERILQRILHQLGWSLPSLPKEPSRSPPGSARP